MYSSDWNNLKVLKAGQKLRIVLKGERRYDGLFRALNDTGITVQQSAGDQTFARKDILRVYCKGDNERIADMVLGGIVGAAFATTLMLSNRRNGWWRSTGWVWPVFMGPGIGIGAAISTPGWRQVYHARRHRGSANSGHEPCVSG